MRRRALGVAAAGIALLAAITAAAALAIVLADDGSAPVRDLYRGSEPPRGSALPAFRLPTYDGGVVDSTELGGRVVLTTFVDTACKDACPIIVSTLARAVARLPQSMRSNVVVLALSVHPAVDTPAHVASFLRERGALKSIEYLVAPAARMRPVWKAFYVLPAVDTGDVDTHSADVRIFDRKGVWVSTQHVGVDLTPANLIFDIRRALGRDEE